MLKETAYTDQGYCGHSTRSVSSVVVFERTVVLAQRSSCPRKFLPASRLSQSDLHQCIAVVMKYNTEIMLNRIPRDEIIIQICIPWPEFPKPQRLAQKLSLKSRPLYYESEKENSAARYYEDSAIDIGRNCESDILKNIQVLKEPQRLD